MPITLKDLIPCIKTGNDLRLLDSAYNEIALIRKNFMQDSLSEKILNKQVMDIWNEDCIEDTINVRIA